MKTRLVVVDVESIDHQWSDIVDPQDLVERSVLVRALLETRRESDLVLLGCEPSMGWALSEVFPGSVLFLGDGSFADADSRPLIEEFVRQYRTGRFGSITVVTGDERLATVAELVVDDRSSLQILSTRAECAELLQGAESVLFRPDFLVGEIAS